MSLCKKLIYAAIFCATVISADGMNLSAETMAVISADIVNVRAEASTNSSIVEKVMEGQKLAVIASEGEWFRVNTAASQNVYVNNQFATLVSAEAAVNDDSVNVRSGPSTASTILGKMNKGNTINVTALNGEFFEFSYNGQKAYIHKDFVAGSLIGYVEKKTAAPARASVPQNSSAQQTSLPIIANNQNKDTVYALVLSNTGLNLRSQPSQESAVITVLSYGEAADILDEGNLWHKVLYNGIEGYVSSEFTMVKTGVKPDNSVRTSMVNYAKQFLGTPYVWGGTNLKYGVDCSGFTYSVYKHFGITLNRTSSSQVFNGRAVKKSELLPGDLVFFSSNGSKGPISHVGIYIGNGSFIHSSSSRSSYCVTISSLREDYYTRNFVSACRIL